MCNISSSLRVFYQSTEQLSVFLMENYIIVQNCKIKVAKFGNTFFMNKSIGFDTSVKTSLVNNHEKHDLNYIIIF